MNTANKKSSNDDRIIGYRVGWTIRVDHPELRDASYPVRDQVYSLPCERFTESFNSAVRQYTELLNGSDDFSSEFVSSVYVDAIWLRRSRTCVRRNVYRTRNGIAA